MDLYNREIVNYSISDRPDTQSLMCAVKQAIYATRSCPEQRIFHSGRGFYYQSDNYVDLLRRNRILQSMSNKGNCFYNAVMENFFGILKKEIYHVNQYYNRYELILAVRNYIGYYNKNGSRRT